MQQTPRKKKCKTDTIHYKYIIGEKGRVYCATFCSLHLGSPSDNMACSIDRSDCYVASWECVQQTGFSAQYNKNTRNTPYQIQYMGVTT